MSIPYKPLSRSNSIRILNIEPTSSPSPLICTLKELDLHDGATYRAFTALSYRWGPPMPTRTITIDSHLVPIRQNLHDFLLLARDGARCHLWIDALCINQDDDVERAEQVKMMGTIYSLASRVLVWLGCLSFEEVHALNEIYDFVEKVPLIVDDDVLWYSEKRERQREAERRRNKLQWMMVSSARTRLEDMFSKTTIRGLVKLLQNEYWTRKWILQELLLAGPNATIINNAVQDKSGSSETNFFSDSLLRPVAITAIAPVIHKILSQMGTDHWTEYRRRYKEWQQAGLGRDEFTYPPTDLTEEQEQIYKLRNFIGCSNTDEGPPGKNGVVKLWEALSQASMNYKPQPLMQLIDTFQDHGCSEREDHVYALLGLSTLSNDKMSGIRIKYGQDIMALFFDTLKLVQDEMCGHHIGCLEKAMRIKPEDKIGWEREYEKVPEKPKAPSPYGDLEKILGHYSLIVELEEAKEKAIKAIEGG